MFSISDSLDGSRMHIKEEGQIPNPKQPNYAYMQFNRPTPKPQYDLFYRSPGTSYGYINFPPLCTV